MILEVKTHFLLKILWFITIFAFINGQDADESNKFQEFVQIQRINGSLLCGGVIIDTQFVITAASCLHGHLAERHIKDIGSDGLKFIINEYKSPNGLGLLEFQPKYEGHILQTALEQPELGDSCKLLGWDIDNEGHPYQLANEINFTTNFLDEVSHVQIGSVCESMTVKVLICKGRLQYFIVRNCVNGQAEYSAIDVVSGNEWINKVFDCFLHKSESCKLKEEADFEVVTTTMSTTQVFSTTEQSTTIEDTTTTSTTTTTTTTFVPSSPSTTTPAYTTKYQRKFYGSNSDTVKPISLIMMISLGMLLFV